MWSCCQQKSHCLVYLLLKINLWMLWLNLWVANPVSSAQIDPRLVSLMGALSWRTEHSGTREGRIAISIFIYMELYLVATGFLILVGDNLHNLLPRMKLKTLLTENWWKRKFCDNCRPCYFAFCFVWESQHSLLCISLIGILASFIILSSIF